MTTPVLELVCPEQMQRAATEKVAAPAASLQEIA
jgi:hypothetical protein